MTKEVEKDKYRATGRTTRLCDRYIQELYEHIGEKVIITDHSLGRNADLSLIYMITRRLAIEHPSDKFKVFRNELSIMIERSKDLV